MELFGSAFARERRLLAAFLLFGAVFFGFAGISALFEFLTGFSSIFLTLFLAWLLAFLVSPVIKLFQRRFSMARSGAVASAFGVTILGMGIFLVFVATIMWVDLQRFIASWPSDQERLEAQLAHFQDVIGLQDPDLVVVFQGGVDQVAKLGGTLTSSAGAIAGGAFSAIGTAVLVVLLALFMAMDADKIIGWFSRLFPMSQRENVELFQHSVGRTFGGFIRTQATMAAIMFILVFAVGLPFGMDYPFVAAFVSALLMFIPMIGPPLALVPPILFAFLFISPFWLALLAILIIAVVQTVLVNAIQPRMMQESLGLHPLLLFVGLLVGVQVAGLWGALFGVPIVAIIAIFVNHWVDLYSPPPAGADPPPAAPASSV